MLEIRTLPDPVLRQRCESVEDFDEELRDLVQEMFDTMYDAEGIGLAAPQVGIPLRVFVMDIRDPDQDARALVNPVVVEHSEETDRDEEGCLSVPGVAEMVERPERIVVEARDPDGERIRMEAGGLLARCIQHEVDHLDGILFLDRISPLKRRLLLRKYEKQRAEEGAGA